MNEPERIIDQLREVLKGVSSETAAAKPIAEAHGIWELVVHAVAWTEAVRRRLQGDQAELTPHEDWPPIEERTEAAWNAALDRLEDSHQQLLRDLEQLSPSRLDEPIGPGRLSVYVTVHGLVQHHVYHAGQIAILKRAASAG